LPHTIPTTEPTEVRAGESWKWDRTLSDHPPSAGWILRYALRGPTDKDFLATAVAEVYQVRQLPTSTDNITPGVYHLTGYVEKEDGNGVVIDREVIYVERLVVGASPLAKVGAGTHAERMIPLIETAIERLAANDITEFSINGRTATRRDIPELRQQLGLYRAELREQRGLSAHRRREVRFSAA